VRLVLSSVFRFSAQFLVRLANEAALFTNIFCSFGNLHARLLRSFRYREKVEKGRVPLSLSIYRKHKIIPFQKIFFLYLAHIKNKKNTFFNNRYLHFNFFFWVEFIIALTTQYNYYKERIF